MSIYLAAGLHVLEDLFKAYDAIPWKERWAGAMTDDSVHELERQEYEWTVLFREAFWGATRDRNNRGHVNAMSIEDVRDMTAKLKKTTT
jgi:hypothetical protein